MLYEFAFSISFTEKALNSVLLVNNCVSYKMIMHMLASAV